MCFNTCCTVEMAALIKTYASVTTFMFFARVLGNSALRKFCAEIRAGKSLQEITEFWPKSSRQEHEKGRQILAAISRYGLFLFRKHLREHGVNILPVKDVAVELVAQTLECECNYRRDAIAADYVANDVSLEAMRAMEGKYIDHEIVGKRTAACIAIVCRSDLV